MFQRGASITLQLTSATSDRRAVSKSESRGSSEKPHGSTRIKSVSNGHIERRVFSEGVISIGLTLPLLSAGNIVADFGEQVALARLAARASTGLPETP